MEPPSSLDSPSVDVGEPAPDIEGTRTSNRIVAFVITGIVIASLALRLWGITWSLPNQDRYFTYHPDEGVNLVNGVFEDGRFRPHLDLGFYNYGTLYFYLWQGACAVNRAYSLVSLPHTDSPRDRSPESVASLILIGRALTAGFGALTVLAVFVLAGRLYGRSCGIAAAIIASVTPLFVVHSRFATVDVTAAFFVTAALAAGACLLNSDTRRDAVIAGGLCGLAAAVKYNAGVVIAAPAAAILMSRGFRGGAHRTIGILLLSAIAAFLIACPAPVTDFAGFREDFTYELRKSGQGMGLLFEDTGVGWVYHTTSSLRYAMGIPLLVFCAAGTLLAILRRKPQDVYLLCFLVLYYVMIGAAQVRFMRYVLPVVPPLAIFGASLFISDSVKKKWLVVIARAAGTIAVSSALLASIALSRTMALVDARDSALAYIRSEVQSGLVIAFPRLPWYDVPPLAPSFTAPDPRVRREAAETLGTWPVRLPPSDRELDLSVFEPTLPDIVVMSDIASQDWERLKVPEWIAFKRRLERAYRPHVFENLPGFAGVTLGKPDHVPNDLLYIFPRITVYTRIP